MNEKAIAAMTKFLQALGIDPTESGMEKTPVRVAAMYEELFSGKDEDVSALWGEIIPTDYDGPVIVRDIPFYSVCEHHLLPFFGKITIVYDPHEGRVAGLSKITKLVSVFSKRPQLQERLTKKIGFEVRKGTEAKGVLVIVEAEHLCMTMRGEAPPGTQIMTVYGEGTLQEQESLRKEVMLLLRGES